VIDSARLVADLKKQLKLLEADLRQRADDPETPWAEGLKLEYERAFARERTARTWSEWSAGELSQAAVAWIVSATFIRFCEDNDLLAGASVDVAPSPAPWLAGPGDRLDRAVEHQTAYFRANPTQTARDWLVQPFRALAALPAGRGLLDPDHSPVWSITISAQAAESLLDFWRATDADGALVHDFTDPALGTRFLGDIYQDLSDYAKSTFALLQTPIFVEEFILDRTLTPAIAEFGLDGLKLIDPTCGSGHFLLGAFDRLVEAWAEKAPAMDARTRAQTALSSIHGVDLNPFAVAIARFRLTVAALLASGERSLVSAPAFAFKLAVGDSLLGWRSTDLALDLGDQDQTFAYSTEDIREYVGILDSNQYHVVVGNPPYIYARDAALRRRYKQRFPISVGKFPLSVPFMQLFFDLAKKSDVGVPAGFVGKITSNSFMTRDSGRLLVENVLSGLDTTFNPVDLLGVIDASGVPIAGHETPPIVLLGRRRKPVSSTVRVASKVSPDTAVGGAHGHTPRSWRELEAMYDSSPATGIYFSVLDLERRALQSHPWSLGGSDVASLISLMSDQAVMRVSETAARMGFFGIVGVDDAFVVPRHVARRLDGGRGSTSLVSGELVRDYMSRSEDDVFFPYDSSHGLLPLSDFPDWERWLWRVKSSLRSRATFGGSTYGAEGAGWHGWHQLPKDDGLRAAGIVLAEIATHNHFAMSHRGDVQKQTAPVIKFDSFATDEDVLDVLAILNSSMACFWLKQTSYNKGPGSHVSLDRFQFAAGKVAEVPIPKGTSYLVVREIDLRAKEVEEMIGAGSLASVVAHTLQADVVSSRVDELLSEMVFYQEELDWHVYARFGIVDETLLHQGDVVGISPSERPFEVLMARQSEVDSSYLWWFEKHVRPPVTRLPSSWPAQYADLVERRISAIQESSILGLLERPEFKRRWVTRGWDSQARTLGTQFILDRLESAELWSDAQGRPVTRSIAQLVELVKNDSDFQSALVFLTGDSGVNVQTAITSLIADEAVPAAAPQRFKQVGLTKFREWQRIWNLQRAQDLDERVTIPDPPKYLQSDFAKPSYWGARGKLDVPKERFIAYPGARRDNDDTAVYGWAGWNHAEQALAASSLLVEMAGAGASSEQLMPIFAALIELEPWLVQWHSDVDPAYGVSPAVAVAGVVDNQLARAGITRDDVAAWKPAAATRGRRAAASTASVASTVEDTP
jgi:hypothetical protein